MPSFQPDTNSAAWKRGYWDAYAGVTDCPYALNTQQETDWYAGQSEGRVDKRNGR